MKYIFLPQPPVTLFKLFSNAKKSPKISGLRLHHRYQQFAVSSNHLRSVGVTHNPGPRTDLLPVKPPRSGAKMSDSEGVSLPVPSRTFSATTNASLLSGFSGRASRNGMTSTIGGRTGGSRRLQSSFTSNGSTGGDRVGSGFSGGKSCQACGVLFTWRQRRHHCRACKKA